MKLINTKFAGLKIIQQKNTRGLNEASLRETFVNKQLFK